MRSICMYCHIARRSPWVVPSLGSTHSLSTNSEEELQQVLLRMGVRAGLMWFWISLPLHNQLCYISLFLHGKSPLEAGDMVVDLDSALGIWSSSASMVVVALTVKPLAHTHWQRHSYVGVLAHPQIACLGLLIIACMKSLYYEGKAAENSPLLCSRQWPHADPDWEQE